MIRVSTSLETLSIILKSNYRLLVLSYRIFELKQQNLMSQRRYEMLANIKWNYSLIIHEAGVPPIHTPVSVLAKLPSNVL